MTDEVVIGKIQTTDLKRVEIIVGEFDEIIKHADALMQIASQQELRDICSTHLDFYRPEIMIGNPEYTEEQFAEHFKFIHDSYYFALNLVQTRKAFMDFVLANEKS